MPPLGLPSLPPLPIPDLGIPRRADDVASEVNKHRKRRMKLSELLDASKWGKESPAVKRTAMGVIFGESRGNPRAANACCHGLMQVNAGAHNKDPEKLKDDPLYNLNVGHDIWVDGGKDWSPEWSAYTNGSYRNMPDGWDPIIEWTGSLTDALGDTVTGAIDDVTDPITAPLEAVAAFFGLLTDKSTWFRGGKVLMGVTLIWGGTMILLVIAAREVVVPAAKKVAAVTPAGKAGNMAGKVAKAGKVL